MVKVLEDMKNLNKKRQLSTDLISQLYGAVTCQSRQYIFYKDYHIPDTPQGRFEVLALHLSLMMRRLKFLHPNEVGECSGLSQKLSDWVVADVEESIRSLPVSELKITRHLKKFMEGFYGRLMAYDKALELNDKGMLEQAIRRNVYEIVEEIETDIVKGLVAYTLQTWDWLEETTIRQIIIDLKGD